MKSILFGCEFKGVPRRCRDGNTVCEFLEVLDNEVDWCNRHEEELEQKADASGDVIAQVVRGTVVTPAGLTLKFKSDTSDLNQAESILTLTGNAHIDTSTQYHLTSDQFISYFKESFLISQTPVVAWGPLGRVTGDIMELRQESANDENRPQDYILKFKNNVKVLYTPDGLAESGALEDAAQLRNVEDLDER